MSENLKSDETTTIEELRRKLHEQVDKFVDHVEKRQLKTDDGEEHKLVFRVGYGGSAGRTREDEHDYYNVLVTRSDRENLW